RSWIGSHASPDPPADRAAPWIDTAVPGGNGFEWLEEYVVPSPRRPTTSTRTTASARADAPAASIATDTSKAIAGTSRTNPSARNGWRRKKDATKAAKA